MSLRLSSGSHRPMAAGAEVALGLSSEPTSFLSRLDRFVGLLDGREPQAAALPAAAAAIVMNVDHFRLARQLDAPCSFAPVSGATWSQAWWSVMELATQAAIWALDRQLDPFHDRLMHQWNEAIALALYAELTARTHLLPTPYLAFQAGMLVAAVGVSEQLRLMEQEDRCPQAMLSQATVRPLENLVMQHELSGSLSLVQVIRKGSYLGPWSTMALAHRLARPQAGLAWVSGLVERVELLPSTRVLEKCLRIRLRSHWPESIELAERVWQTAVAVAKRGV